MKTPRLIRDDSGEREGWWLGERFIPDGDEPAKVYNLKPVPTEDLLAELGARGIRYEDLQWEDCGVCFHFKGINEKTGVCNAGRRPVWFPDGPSGHGDPHEVGFYAVGCEKRKVPFETEQSSHCTEPRKP